MWKWLDQYFTFTKSERQAIIALVILSVIVLLAPKVYFFFKPAAIVDSSKYQKELDAFANSYQKETNEMFEASQADSSNAGVIKPVTAASNDTTKHFARKPVYAVHYFQFDPNKIGVNEWVRLGFTEKQAGSIEKYKSKGGKSYKPVDLKRLYVMTDEHYEKLEPYIKIDVDALPKREYRRKDGSN